MNDDDYTSIPVTADMLKDPDEPGINPLEAMSRRLEADMLKTGLPIFRSELRPGSKPTYKVSFVPRRKAPPDEK